MVGVESAFKLSKGQKCHRLRTSGDLGLCRRTLATPGVGLRPGTSANNDVSWQCGAKALQTGVTVVAASSGATTDVLAKYLPAVCRV